MRNKRILIFVLLTISLIAAYSQNPSGGGKKDDDESGKRRKSIINYDLEPYYIRQLFESIEKNDIKRVKQLIKNGADLDFLSKKTYTPLILAVCMNRIEVIEILLDNQAKIDLTGFNGNTALMLSSKYGFVEAAKLLLKHHPDLKIKNNDGKTAFDLAGEKVQNDAIVKILNDAVNK